MSMAFDFWIPTLMKVSTKFLVDERDVEQDKNHFDCNQNVGFEVRTILTLLLLKSRLYLMVLVDSVMPVIWAIYIKCRY